MDEYINPSGYWAFSGYPKFLIIGPPNRCGLASNQVFLWNKRQFELAVFKNRPPQEIDDILIHLLFDIYFLNSFKKAADWVISKTFLLLWKYHEVSSVIKIDS